MARNGKARHVLSNIDEEGKTADCAECGRRVDLHSKGGARRGWECGVSHRARSSWRRSTVDGFIAGALSAASNRASGGGLPFNLYEVGNQASLDAAIVRLIDVAPLRCPVFPWIEMRYEASGNGTAGARPPGTASLDRIDPALGYVWGNVRWVSVYANTLRRNMTADEIVHLFVDFERVKPAPEAYPPQTSEGPCIPPGSQQ